MIAALATTLLLAFPANADAHKANAETCYMSGQYHLNHCDYWWLSNRKFKFSLKPNELVEWLPMSQLNDPHVTVDGRPIRGHFNREGDMEFFGQVQFDGIVFINNSKDVARVTATVGPLS